MVKSSAAGNGLKRSAVALVGMALTLACADRTPLAPAPPSGVGPVMRVVVTAPRQVLAPGDSVHFTSQAFNAQGLVLSTATVTWSTSSASVATVDSRGVVTALSEGTAQITATANGQSDVVDVSVSITQLCDCTRILDSTATTLVQRNDTSGVYVFRIVGGVVPALDSGSIIVGAEDGGFLRRVHRTTRAGDLITVETTQAYLEEAVREGEWATTSFSEGENVPLEAGATVWGPWTTTYVAPSLTSAAVRCCSLDGLGFSIKLDPGKLFLDGKVDFTIKDGELVFEPRVDIAGSISAFRLQSFRTAFRGDIGLNIDEYELKVTLEASEGVTLLKKESLKFITQRRPFATFIGPMPLVGVITKTLKLEITPTVGGSASFTGLFRTGFGVSAGMAWSRSGGWSPISGSSSYFEATAPQFQGVEGNASVKIAVVPEYAILFYGAVGPFVNLEPYAEAAGAAALSFDQGAATGLDWETKVSLGLNVNIGAKFSVLGFKDLFEAAFAIPIVQPYKLIRGFSDGPLVVRTAVTGEDQPDSLHVRLRPAFPDIYELGIGPVVLVETSGSPPFGRDLATSSQDVRVVPDDSATLQEVRSGASFPHTVSLHELPGNCTVADSSSDSVAVRSNAFLALPLVQADTTRATLFADCIPMGAMRIRTVTTGPDPVKRHTLTLTRRDKVGSGKGTPPLNLTIPGGSTPPDTVIDKLVPANPANGANGRIDATLDAGRRNCAVAKPTTHQATITSGDTALAEFRITCVPLGHVRIRTTTSDPDAAAPSEAITYALAAIAKDPRDRVTGADRAAGADGVAAASASVGATDTAMVDGLVPLYNASGATGGHDVTLSNAPDRCVETAQFTRSVTVFPGDTALAPFAIQCVERLHVSARSTGPGSDGDGYIVVIENSDGSADSVAIAVNDTVGIAGVTPGQHVIRLVDVDPGCNAPPSTNATVSGRDSTLVAFSVHCPGPAAPTGLRTTQVLPTQVDLAWDPAPLGRPVAHYTLYRSNAVAPFNPVVVQSIAATSYSDPGLTPFTLYLYQVAGVDSDGVVGPRSAVLPVRTRDGTPPTAPGGLTALAVSASRIDLAWTAASDPQSGISRYRVYRDGALVDSTSTTSFFDVGLSATTSYTYHVIAVNGEGLAGPPSNNATATTLDGSPPTAPTGLVATPISTSRIDLTWSPAGDPESGIGHYRIYRNGTFAGTSATLAFADQGLTPNTTYTYEVSAVNGASLEGPRTPPVTATTLAPVATGSLTVNTVSQGSGIPAAGYQVEVSASGVLLTQPIGATASVTFAGLVPQTYTVTLQNLPANCAVDDGPNPTSVVVTSGATVSITFRVRCQ